MGCFLDCFGSSKNRKNRKRANKVLPRDQQKHGNQELLQPAINPNSELRDRADEQLSFSTRKKVTFDLNVETYEEVSSHEIADCSSVIDEEKEREKKEEKTGEESKPISISEDNVSIKSSLGSYPSNHRYQNCRNSDDEFEEIESEESDNEEEEEDDDYTNYDDDLWTSQEESSETFFSSSNEPLDQVSGISAMEEEGKSSILPYDSPNHEQQTLGLNRNARDRSQYVHSVLNPVENLSQWKAVKAKSTPPLKHQKENFNFEQEPHLSFSSEPTFKLPSLNSSPYSKAPKKDIAVDASLSNWLVPEEITPTIALVAVESSERSISQWSNSPRSLEDRPILGALTMEELKQFSATSSRSPRRSPSPDEMPILGTVGTYWNHRDQGMNSISSPSFKGIPNTTSKYREDKKVNWHSTPFEQRLERALKTGVATEGNSSCVPSV